MESIRRMLFFMNYYEQHTTRYKVLVILLQNLRKIPEMTIQEVADFCFVSQSTVSRLLQEMGFANYAVFKSEIARAVQLEAAKAENSIIPQYNVFEQMHNRYIQMINTIFTPDFLEQIKGIARQMKQSSKICILLWSRREFIDLERVLFLDGKRITVHDVAEIAPQYISDLKEGDLFLTCIANEEEYLIKRAMLEDAHNNGAAIAIVANDRLQSICNWDFHLPIWPDVESSALWSEVISKVLLVAYQTPDL